MSTAIHSAPSPSVAPSSSPGVVHRARSLLACSGAAIIFAQYVAVRELGSTFFSTEFVLLAATAVTLLGPSAGYALGARVSGRVLAVWGALAVAAALAMPVGLRALVGVLAARGASQGALATAAFAAGLLPAGFFAGFLPRSVRTGVPLGELYAIELVGALCAIALVALLPSWRAMLAAQGLVCALALHLGLGRRVLSLVVAGVALSLALAHPLLDRAAARTYYRGYHGLTHAEIRETRYSPYQRIDVVDDLAGPSLFLDGVPFYRAGDLDAFNVALAAVPAALGPRRGEALVVGSGSFSSAAHVRRAGYSVTVVEIDAEVAEVGLRHFAPARGLGRDEIRLVIDDARRFLARAAPASYDLIVLDVPAPYHVRSAMLYTPEFYRLVASRLRAGGVAALSLCDGVEGPVGRAIAASVLRAFSSALALETEDTGLAFVYASAAALPFGVDDVAREVERRSRGGARIYTEQALRERAESAEPVGAGGLATVALLARGALRWTRGR